MSKSRKGASLLKQILRKLPSDKEKLEGIRVIDEILAEMKRLREELRRLPDERERKRVIQALATVDSFMRSSVVNAGSRSKGQDSGNKEKARILLDRLNELSTDEIARTLRHPESAPTAVLRAAASILGLGGVSKMARDDLEDAIVKVGFANPRGYELISQGKLARR